MKNGPYELVRAPNDYPGRTYRGSRRYVYEHVLVWWWNTGHVPNENEVVHHRNENKRDNRFRNLEVKTRAGHAQDHANRERLPPIVSICGHCETELKLAPAVYRKRASRSQTGEVYCSRACGMRASWARRNFPL